MIALDTSVIIAGLLEWHENHDVCHAALDDALGATAGVALPLPALIESYSVMTRLPAPHRLSPADALALLESTFRGAAKVVVVKPGKLWSELGSWSRTGVSGGRAYDAHILACARSAAATKLLTLNGRHFSPLAGDDIEIVVPAA
jgi:predicted nucleic acid-binding protein